MHLNYACLRLGPHIWMNIGKVDFWLNLKLKVKSESTKIFSDIWKEFLGSEE